MKLDLVAEKIFAHGSNCMVIWESHPLPMPSVRITCEGETIESAVYNGLKDHALYADRGYRKSFVSQVLSVRRSAYCSYKQSLTVDYVEQSGSIGSLELLVPPASQAGLADEIGAEVPTYTVVDVYAGRQSPAKV